MRLKGTLIQWNDARGFGFIEPSGGGERVFGHVKAFAIRVRRPVPGDAVTYELSKDSQGRSSALRVKPAGLEDARYNANLPSQRSASQRRPAATGVASSSGSAATACICVAIFFAAVVALTVAGRIPFFMPFVYLVLSGITIFAYAFDKSAAMNRRWRTREQTLHILELLGGWPGGWIAQRFFRHKSRKGSYLAEFWLCVILNVSALAWYAGLLDRWLVRCCLD